MNSVNPWRLGLASAACIAALMATGCSSSSSHVSASEPVINRPLVDQTAVEATAGDASALAFFDDLESRPLASQDDAINACLLLGTGSTGSSYEQRVAMATRLGYIPGDYNRPARQAVTMGEVATMSIKLLEGRKLSQEDAMTKLVQRGIAPASARYNQGLTGAQLVSITGGVRDAMRIEGVQRVAAPVVAVPVKPVAVVEVAPEAAKASAPVPPEAALSTGGVALGEAAKDQGKAGVAASVKGAANAPAPEAASAATASGPAMATGAKGHAEPLPRIPPGTVPPAIDLSDPKAKPSVIGPDAKVITPGQNKAKPTTTPGTPTAEPKPEPEPKPQAQAAPSAMPTVEPAPQTASDQPSSEKAKKLPRKLWTPGQPVKKVAGAEEGK